MKMQQEKLLQIVESYLNIISNEVDEKEYRKFIEVYEIVKNKVKCLDESRS